MSNTFPALLLTMPILFPAILSVISANNKKYYVHLVFIIAYMVLSLIFLIHDPYHKIAIAMSGWDDQFSIVFKYDLLTKIFLALIAFMGFAVTVYMYQDEKINKCGNAFYVGFWFLLLSALGVLATQDIFNLYVWLEVMLVASVSIIASSVNIQIKDALKEYALINIFSTLLILLSIGLIYGQTGILSYSGIASYMSTHDTFIVAPIYLLVIGLLIKGAAFPFYFWLPNTYSRISTSAILMLSSINTKLIMIAFIRLYPIWSAHLLHGSVSNLLGLVGIVTMLFGVMGAANQFDMKSILSFHITSQIGYMLIAISLVTSLGFVAAIFFIVHNILTKSVLFMSAGYIENNYKSAKLSDLGATLSSNKFNAMIFFVAAMSLAGFPPLSGFVAKFLVIKSTLIKREYLSTFFVLFVSLFTLYSMIKIWRYGFCQSNEHSIIPKSNNRMSYSFYISSGLVVLLVIYIGLDPDLLLTPMTRFFS